MVTKIFLNMLMSYLSSSLSSWSANIKVHYPHTNLIPPRWGGKITRAELGFGAS